MPWKRVQENNPWLEPHVWCNPDPNPRLYSLIALHTPWIFRLEGVTNLASNRQFQKAYMRLPWVWIRTFGPRELRLWVWPESYRTWALGTSLAHLLVQKNWDPGVSNQLGSSWVKVRTMSSGIMSFWHLTILAHITDISCMSADLALQLISWASCVQSNHKDSFLNVIKTCFCFQCLKFYFLKTLETSGGER